MKANFGYHHPFLRPWPLLFLVFTLLPWQPAQADQCQLLTQAQAEKALPLIQNSSEILMFCLPCGDQKPVLHQVQKAALKKVDEGFEVQVWGPQGPVTPFDLAYIYIPDNGQKGLFHNLAMLSDCPVMGVPMFIDKTGPVKKEISPEKKSFPTQKMRPKTAQRCPGKDTKFHAQPRIRG